MSSYIDGFVLPIAKEHLDTYQKAAEQIAEIWKEYGALEYVEYVGDDLQLEGTRSFVEVVEKKENEVVLFGWVKFPSKEVRESANQQVPKDPRMHSLVAPLIEADKTIFDAKRMIYGGFAPLV